MAGKNDPKTGIRQIYSMINYCVTRPHTNLSPYMYFLFFLVFLYSSTNPRTYATGMVVDSFRIFGLFVLANGDQKETPRYPTLTNRLLPPLRSDSDTLMAARSQPNDNWGSVGNGAKHGEKHVGGGSGM